MLHVTCGTLSERPVRGSCATVTGIPTNGHYGRVLSLRLHSLRGKRMSVMGSFCRLGSSHGSEAAGRSKGDQPP